MVELGEPAAIARRYNELNFGRARPRARRGASEPLRRPRGGRDPRRLVRERRRRARSPSMAQGEPVHASASRSRSTSRLEDPVFAFTLRNERGTRVRHHDRLGRRRRPAASRPATASWCASRSRTGSRRARYTRDAVDRAARPRRRRARPARGPRDAGRARRAHHTAASPTCRTRSTAASERDAARGADPPATAVSVLGDDLRRFVELTFTLAATDFKLRYFGSVLGYSGRWCGRCCSSACSTSCSPRSSDLGDDVPHYPVYLLMSIVLWTFFPRRRRLRALSLVARENLLRKIRFPRLVIPLSVALDRALRPRR